MVDSGWTLGASPLDVAGVATFFVRGLGSESVSVLISSSSSLPSDSPESLSSLSVADFRLAGVHTLFMVFKFEKCSSLGNIEFDEL